MWAEGAEKELEEEGYDGAICAGCCLGWGGRELGILGGVVVVAHVNERSWGARKLPDCWWRPLGDVENWNLNQDSYRRIRICLEPEIRSCQSNGARQPD